MWKCGHMGFGEIVGLGIVQGLTEFLPISSSGHLVAVRVLFGLSDVGGNAFDAFLHLGTLGAVLFYFWRLWWGVGRAFFVWRDDNREQRVLAGHLVLATLPAGVVGYIFQESFGLFFRSPLVVALGMVFTALVLLLVDLHLMTHRSLGQLTRFDALMIGLVQIVSLVPGVSRSGVTMAAGRSRGLSRKDAATFSFLMSAPIIAGAGLASLESLVVSGSFSVGELIAGFVASFTAGILAIAVLLKVVERVSFLPFVVYLIILGGLVGYFG